MRYRSTLHTSRYIQAPKVSICQILTPTEQLDPQLLRQNLDAIKLKQGESEFLLLVSEKTNTKNLKVEFANDLAEGHLKVATYSKVANSRLLNIVSGLASGIIIMTMGAQDILAPRMANYIYEELLTELERALVFEKRGKLPKRIAMFRNTFYEIGGFDEALKPDFQIKNMAKRIEQIGVEIELRPHAHLTNTNEKRRRSFAFFKQKPTAKLEFEKPKEDEYKWLT